MAESDTKPSPQSGTGGSTAVPATTSVHVAPKHEPVSTVSTSSTTAQTLPLAAAAKVEQPRTTSAQYAPNPSLLKRKRQLETAGYTRSEIAEIESRAASFDLALALDQNATLYPSAPTPFTSFEDVVERLMPYHVWQIPDEELLLPTEQREAEDLKHSSELVQQLVDIRERFGKVRRREGQNASDVTSLIKLIQESTSQVRDELQIVHGQLRQARAIQEAREAEARRQREIIMARQNEQIRLDEERRRREVYAATLRANAAAQAAKAAAAATPPRPPVPPAPIQRPPLVAAAAAAVTPSPVRPPNTGTPAARPQTPVVAGSAVPATTTPATQSAPSTTVAAGATTPSTPLSPTRGRPRGRPRGRGRGGLREAVLTHSAVGASTPAVGPSAAAPFPSTPASASTSATASASSSPSGISTPQKSGEPVQITVPMHQLPQYVAARILVLPQDSSSPKAPATVIRTSEDRKSATFNLGACNPAQLQTLARLLNVQARPNGSGGTTTASPATAASIANAQSASSAPPKDQST